MEQQKDILVKELVLKVTSTCNLNCSYCYVFNQGDNSFSKEPSILKHDLVDQILNKIEDYCSRFRINNFLIIFHGGEPLLAGKSFYISFIKRAKELVKSTTLTYTMQTNGTLLDHSWCKLLSELNIQVGVSLDGTRLASKYRVYKKNNLPAYDDIIKGLECLRTHDKIVSVLCVVNVNENPSELYNHIKDLNISSIDLLFPDATFDKPEEAVGKIGYWLINIFDHWYSDNSASRPKVRIFEVLINLILGNSDIGNEPWGRRYNGVITIKSNGNIEPVDSLKICKNGITGTNYNVIKNNIDDIFDHELFLAYYNAHQESVLCAKCNNCIINDICGGSQLAHRYSSMNIFNNHSVYCHDIIKLVTHIQNKLIANNINLAQCGMEPLTPEDFDGI